MPRQGPEDESDGLSRLAHAFLDAQFDADSLPEPERVEFVTRKLKMLESAGLD
jgi:hypothetical protein